MNKRYKSAIKKARINANVNIIKSSANKNKAAWSLIKSNPVYKSQECLISPNDFNSFFVEYPSMMKADLPHCNQTAYDLLLKKSKPNVEFHWNEVTSDEVFRCVRGLKNSKTKDIYDISNNLVKDVIPFILHPLTICFNNCLATGKFPTALKISRVTPIYKKGSKEDPSNYRPISIIPVFATIFEKLMKKQLADFFERNNILYSNQFGFRSERNTTDAVVCLINYVLESLEKGEIVNSTFCDLTKAFDFIEHDILLEKLKYYGISGKELLLLTHYLKDRQQRVFHCDYLKDRQQRVFHCGNKSDAKWVKHGVPQGSVLGPFLFLISINDVYYNISSNVILYADDTTILNSHNSPHILEMESNQCLSEAKSWFNANGLILNENKTKSLVYSLSSTSKNDHFRMLGNVVDSKLTWEHHVDTLCLKLSRNLYLFKSLRDILPLSYVKTAYFAYFHSVASYGILLWGNSAHVGRVLKLQKRAVRIITGSGMTEHCRPIFIKEKILTVICLYIRELLCYIKERYESYEKRSDFHQYTTRQNHLLTQPCSRLSKTMNSFHIMAIRVANRLPVNIFDLNYVQFKRKITDWLINNPFYNIQEFLNCEIVL